MEANEPLIVQLQAHWRGALVRRPFQDRLEYLRKHEAQAVLLQAHVKGYQQRKAYQDRLEFLRKQAAIIVRVCRGHFLVSGFISLSIQVAKTHHPRMSQGYTAD